MKNINFDRIYLWTDSKVTLSWIKSVNKEYKTFVENRLREIRANTDIKNWFYCPTHLNPADLITRTGITKEFTKNELWWGGPEFLRSDNVQINDNSFLQANFDQDELINTCVYVKMSNESNLCNLNDVIEFRRYSNYNNIL